MGTGKEKFKHVEQEIPQEYALAITFSYEGKEDIQLYTKLKDNVSTRARQTERDQKTITLSEISCTSRKNLWLRKTVKSKY